MDYTDPWCSLCGAMLDGGMGDDSYNIVRMKLCWVSERNEND